MTKFYVDSCIYLNIWKGEGDLKYGKPYWEIAKDFFEFCENKKDTILYSGFLLKELEFIFGKEKFQIKKEKIFESNLFKRIYAYPKDYNTARKIEKEINYKISFFDILHMILSKNNDAILITRDKELIKTAKKYLVPVRKPEEL